MTRLDIFKVKQWYKREWVADIISQDCSSREAMVMLRDGRVKRPVSVESPGDVPILVEEGAISFHRTVEKFLDITEYTDVLSYDIIIDVDFNNSELPLQKQLEAITTFAKHLIDFLYDFGFKENEIGIKYSGNHGIHIRLTTDLLEEDATVFGIPVKRAFPLFAKNVVEFVNTLSLQIKAELADPVYNYVVIDTQVASPRHMIRSVLSVNEKLPGVSYPLAYEELQKLPSEYTKYKFPYALELEEPSAEWTNIKSSNRIIDLIRLASIWVLFNEATTSYLRSQEYKTLLKKLRKRKTGKIKITPELEENEIFPPCIRNILSGLEDGRKRAVFILINFLSNIGWDWDRIEKKLWEWNEKNKDPIRERYIEYQLDWHKRVYSQGKKYLPPNCDNETYYRDMVSVNGPVCQPDDLCSVIKNPLVYYLKKLKLIQGKKQEEKEQYPKDLI